MSSMDKVAKELYSAMTKKDERVPKPYDTEATVVREEGDTIWVKIPGGIDETPVRKTINAKPGDNVQVRVANGRAWVMGNSTNPPTDDSTANYAVNIANGAQKDVVVLNTVVADNIQATNAKFEYVEADTAKIHTLEADEIHAGITYTNELIAQDVTTENLTAASGYIQDLTADHITAGDIIADHATIDDLDANYAQIDMANVNNAWIENGTIKKAEVFDENVFDLSGNRATLSRLDASKINVANLRADNLVVRRINGQPVVGGYTLIDSNSPGYSSKNPQALGWYEFVNADWILSTDTTVDMTKAYYQEGNEVSLYDQAYIDGLESDLQQQIDGAVETYTGSVVPTLTNWPYTDWYDTSVTPIHDERAKHIGDIYYVVNSSSPQGGYCYRFAYDNTTHAYSWVLIKDSDVTKALSDISELQTFESETTSWIDETDQGLETIRTNHTNLVGVVDKTVKESVQLWFTKANTTAPSKPTAEVTSTSTAGNAWRKVVPAYNASYPNYFYCWQYKFVDGTFGWSDVVRDIAMGETQGTARDAKNTADAALPAQTFEVFESTTFTDLVDEVDEQSTTMTNMTTRLGLNADGTQSATDIVSKETALEQTVDGISTRVGKTEAHLIGMYATSSTAAGTAAKVATITPAIPSGTNWELSTGTTITVKFTNANTTASPTLNVNSKGAKPIKTYANGNLSEAEYKWKAGSTFTFTYNGTNWLMQDSTASVRINTNETQINQTADSIISLASGNTTYTKPDGTTATSAIGTTVSQTANNVLIKATRSGATDTEKSAGGTSAIGLINVSPDNVVIAAKHVDIAGAAVFNDYSTTQQMKTAIGNAVDGIEVGGRNLFVNTGGSRAFDVHMPNDSCTWNGFNDIEMSNGEAHFAAPATTAEKYWRWLAPGATLLHGLTAGETYTLSFKIKGSVGSNGVSIRSQWNLGSGWTGGTDYGILNASAPISDYKLVSVTETIPANATGYYISIQSYDNTANNNFYIKDIKFEKGTKATDWTPAPEDVEAEINSKKSTHTIASANTTGSGWATILGWEGTVQSFWVANGATVGVKINDTVRIGYIVSDMNNSTVYIIGTVTSIPDSTHINMTVHGIDTTVINGGMILANSIGANQIKANEIGTDLLTVQARNEVLNSNIEIGGRNFLSDTKAFGQKNTTGLYLAYASETTLTSNSYNGAIIRNYPSTTLTNTNRNIVEYYFPTSGNTILKLGKSFCLSFWAKGSGKFVTYLYSTTAASDPSYCHVTKFVASDGEVSTTASDGGKVWTLTSSWKRYWIVYTLAETGHTDNRRLLFRHNSTSGTNTLACDICGLKFEEGTNPSEWTEAPEDIQAEIDAKKSVHTLDSAYSFTYANILTYSAEGYGASNSGANWNVASTIGVKAGDTVRIKVVASDMSNTPVYIVGTVTSIVSGTQLKMISHGLDTTVIDGGHILTGTLDATKVNVTNLNASNISSGTINTARLDANTIKSSIVQTTDLSADKITSGSIASDRIKANVINAVNNGTGTINADKINVSQINIGSLSGTIGGRNLLLNTVVSNLNREKCGFSSSYVSTTMTDGIICYKFTGNNTVHGFNYLNEWYCLSSRLKANTTYTYSFWAKYTKAASFNFTSYGHFQVNNANSSSTSDKTHEDVVAKRVYSPASVAANVWTKMSITFTTNNLANSSFGIYPLYNNGADTIMYAYGFKLEEGSKATDWTPAPEDEFGENIVRNTDETTEYSVTVSSTESDFKNAFSVAVPRVSGENVYTVSFDAKATTAHTVKCFWYSPNTTTAGKSSTGQTTGSGDGAIDVSLSTAWQRYSVTWVQSDTVNTNKNLILCRVFIPSSGSVTTSVRAVKMEVGAIAKPWSVSSKDLAATATNYISADSSGINIASANPATQNQKIRLTSGEVGFYDSSGNKRMYMTVSNVVAGLASGAHSVFNDGGVAMYDANARQRAIVGSNGLDVYDTDGTTNVANFGASARVGKAASKHISIDATNGMQVFTGTESASTNVAQFGSSIRVGSTSSNRIEIDSSSFDVRDADSFLQFSVTPSSSSTSHTTTRTVGTMASGQQKATGIAKNSTSFTAKVTPSSGSTVTQSISIPAGGAGAQTSATVGNVVFTLRRDSTNGYIRVTMKANAAARSVSYSYACPRRIASITAGGYDLCYAPGDWIPYYYWHGSGYLTNSKTNIWVTLPVNKPILAENVTVANVYLITRQEVKYTHGSSADTNVSWTVESATLQPAGVQVCLSRSTTTNASNNSPIGIDLVCDMTFS